MSAWTPGPWKYRKWHTDSREELDQLKILGLSPILNLGNDGSARVMAERGRVATVDCVAAYKRGHGHETECEERDANARLISEAPAMAGLLQRYLDAAAFSLRVTDIDADTRALLARIGGGE